MDKLQERKKRLEHRWVGKTVISITNAYQTIPEDPSIEKGTVEGIDILGNNLFPVILYEDGKQRLTMSCVIEYRKDIWDALVGIGADTRWRLLEKVVCKFNDIYWRD